MMLRRRKGEDLYRAQRTAAAACLGVAAVVGVARAALTYTSGHALPNFLQAVLYGIDIGVLVLAVLLLAASRRGRPQSG